MLTSVVWLRLVVAYAVLAGCAIEGTTLDAWTLDVAGGPRGIAVSLPSTLRSELPAGELDYTLTTTVTLRPELHGRSHALVFDCFHAPLAVTVNGTRLGAVSGGADGSWLSVIPASLASSTPLTIVLSVHRNGESNLGFGAAPRLTDDPRGDPRFRWVASFNRHTAIAALCFLGLLAVLYTTLALLERGRPVYVSLVAYSLTASVTALLSLGVLR